MSPILNIAFQRVLSTVIKTLGFAGTKAAAVNVAGQGVIHGINVAAGPVGWVLTEATLGWTAYQSWKLHKDYREFRKQ
jgi:uncharacterized protein YaaW (UPF0174 family)